MPQDLFVRNVLSSRVFEVGLEWALDEFLTSDVSQTPLADCFAEAAGAADAPEVAETAETAVLVGSWWR